MIISHRYFYLWFSTNDIIKKLLFRISLLISLCSTLTMKILCSWWLRCFCFFTWTLGQTVSFPISQTSPAVYFLVSCQAVANVSKLGTSCLSEWEVSVFSDWILTASIPVKLHNTSTNQDNVTRLVHLYSPNEHDPDSSVWTSLYHVAPHLPLVTVTVLQLWSISFLTISLCISHVVPYWLYLLSLLSKLLKEQQKWQ